MRTYAAPIDFTHAPQRCLPVCDTDNFKVIIIGLMAVLFYVATYVLFSIYLFINNYLAFRYNRNVS